MMLAVIMEGVALKKLKTINGSHCRCHWVFVKKMPNYCMGREKIVILN